MQTLPLFKIFSFTFLKGDPATALREPNNVVITEGEAEKYFGQADAIGKTLSLDGKSMTVTGVTKNVPVNSHFSYDFLISMATAIQKGSGYDWMFNNWYSNDFYTYLLLPDHYDVSKITAQFNAFAKRHSKVGSTTRHNYSLEKLSDIYLYSDRENQIGPTGNLKTLYIFSAIAIFILIIACINFINLSTARAAERAKEVGIKKVNGVTRSQLIAQFFTESFLMTSIALTVAVLLSSAVLPAFNAFSGNAITFTIFTPVHLLAFAAVLMVVGLLSGSYPAFILSSFNPVTALKGKLSASAFSIGMRKGLVIFQFVISIVLIISSTIVYRQLKFMQHHDLGFKPSQTLVINFEGDNTVQHQYKFIENELKRVPGVKSVTASSNVPGDLNSGGWSMDFVKHTGDTVHAEFPVYRVDFNYLSQFDIPMVAGRAFSEQYAVDTAESLLINETALKKLGLSDPQDAIGIKVGMYPTTAKIIGVYKDFHFESLQKAIQPLALRVVPQQFSLFALQISTNDLKQTIAGIEKVWKNDAPQRPFEYSFLDESFNRQYQSDIKFGQLFAVFTSLAIAIACFGLFGLALFSVKQRTKEIGIRKVVGASVLQISTLLSKDFISLVVVAIIIASPLALYVMNQWLQSFAYRVDITWWIFASGGFIAIIIALCTVGYQAVNAALANPVKSLKME